MQCFDGEIVESATDAVYVDERQRMGVRSVRQQHENSVIRGIDPKRCSRKSIVSKALRRQ
jgi:hypothetical protein